MGCEINPKHITKWTLHNLCRRVTIEHLGCFDGNGERSVCWVWQKGCDKDGYPQIKLGGMFGSKYKAHRVAYVMFTGDFDIAGSDVHHLCNVRNCINPQHLEKRKSWGHRAGEGDLPF